MSLPFATTAGAGDASAFVAVTAVFVAVAVAVTVAAAVAVAVVAEAAAASESDQPFIHPSFSMLAQNAAVFTLDFFQKINPLSSLPIFCLCFLFYLLLHPD